LEEVTFMPLLEEAPPIDESPKTELVAKFFCSMPTFEFVLIVPSWLLSLILVLLLLLTTD
jgi:hypothetical protein